jgi:hypothetical protein
LPPNPAWSRQSLEAAFGPKMLLAGFFAMMSCMSRIKDAKQLLIQVSTFNQIKAMNSFEEQA